MYDLKNERDLSRYYCTDASNIFSSYLYEEYAAQLKEAVNDSFTSKGMEKIFSDVDCELDLDLFKLRRDEDGIEMFENVITEKKLCYHWYSLSAAGTYWDCKI